MVKVYYRTQKFLKPYTLYLKPNNKLMAKKKGKKKIVVRKNENAKSKETSTKVVKTTRTVPKTTRNLPKTTSRVNKSSRGRRGGAKATASVEDILFNKNNYTWMIGGLVVIFIGFLLMAGGGMEDPAVWDDSEIYGFRRTVLAPFLVIAGLVIQIFAIFRK